MILKYSISQAARRLNLHYQSVYKMFRRGDLPGKVVDREIELEVDPVERERWDRDIAAWTDLLDEDERERLVAVLSDVARRLARNEPMDNDPRALILDWLLDGPLGVEEINHIMDDIAIPILIERINT